METTYIFIRNQALCKSPRSSWPCKRPLNACGVVLGFWGPRPSGHHIASVLMVPAGFGFCLRSL